MITSTVQMMSKSLGRHVSYTVIVPEAANAGPGPYPVLYLLHGKSDNHTGWLLYSNLIRYASKFPMIIVLPDGGVSYWMNVGPRERLEDFLMKDLPASVGNTFNVKEGKAAIGGLSMGGFGSMRLALKYPERFASVWCHSSAFWSREEMQENSIPYGDLDDADIYLLARQAQDKDLPTITFDCGVDDRLLPQNRRFHAYLTDLGIKHTYREHPGAHSWDYWDQHVQSALIQHARALNVKIPASIMRNR